MDKIKVLIVDDSAFMRKVISDILRSHEGIEISGTAGNGADALEKIKKLDVDVITLDIEMPVMDGLTTLKKIMETMPIPVVMISAHTKEGVDATLKALEYGAADFVTKPDGVISLNLEKSKDEIINKVIAASKVNIKRLRTESQNLPGEIREISPGKSIQAEGRIVIIGSSTGGPQTLEYVLPRLPKDLPSPVLVVQHMPADFTRSLAERLDKISALRIREAKAGDRIEKGVILIAPGDYHMELKILDERKKVFGVSLNQNPREQGVRPCVNITMKSAAKAYGKGTLGVVLTGMGADGTEGCKEIKSAGGVTIAEDEKSCIIYGMPKSAVEAGAIDHVESLENIPKKIVECLCD